MIVHKGKNITVVEFNDVEIIVYGSGSDWMVQTADATNPKAPWRKWFCSRELAERFATGGESDNKKGGST